MRMPPRPLWCVVLALSLSCASIPHPVLSANAANQLLRYTLATGSTYAMRFSLTSTKTIRQPGYPDRHFHEVTTGLEQATIAQLFPDGASLFQYHFAGLVDAGSASPARYAIDTGGPPAAVAADQYVISQAVGVDGHAEVPTQQCNPTAGLGDLAPFSLLPLTPMPYPAHPVVVGDSWTAQLPADDDAVPTAHVQLMSESGSSGRFVETVAVPIHIDDRENYLRLSGTTLITATATQDLVSGVPSTWNYQVTTAISRTDTADTPGKLVVLHYLSSQILDASVVPAHSLRTHALPSSQVRRRSRPQPRLQWYSHCPQRRRRSHASILALQLCPAATGWLHRCQLR